MDALTTHPPATIEGWYALHQVFAVDRPALRAVDQASLPAMKQSAAAALRELAVPAEGGWSAVVPLVGSTADMMLVHFRPTLDALGAAQRRAAREPFFDVLRPVYSFLSITEAGLYHVTAELAKQASTRGGAVGDEEYTRELARRTEAERSSAHLQRRLYPPLPPEMPYVCFYPMSKKRVPGQNWYALSLEERSRLMYSHGLTGRQYAGKIQQVVCGAIGLDEWEWGVTLFAKDPLEFKNIVTEMRFDEASAQYAEFGRFYVGKVAQPEEWLGAVG
jgi:chlorite dismutase